MPGYPYPTQSNWCGFCPNCGRFVGGGSGSRKMYDGNGEHRCGPGYNTADEPTLVVGFEKNPPIRRNAMSLSQAMRYAEGKGTTGGSPDVILKSMSDEIERLCREVK